MILDFEDVIEKANQINKKHVSGIKMNLRKMSKTIYFDDRTIEFRIVKPFAFDGGYYYVCCPCCHQIEKISAASFNNGYAAMTDCSNGKCKSEKIIMYEDDMDDDYNYKFRIMKYKIGTYTVDLTDWLK